MGEFPDDGLAARWAKVSPAATTIPIGSTADCEVDCRRNHAARTCPAREDATVSFRIRTGRRRTVGTKILMQWAIGTHWR
jgi:hypothetical protein